METKTSIDEVKKAWDEGHKKSLSIHVVDYNQTLSDKQEPKQLAPWQKELQKKFNKQLGESDKKETLSQDSAKKLLGDGLVK